VNAEVSEAMEPTAGTAMVGCAPGPCAVGVTASEGGGDMRVSMLTVR